MFKCGCCSKTIGPRVASQVIEVERRQVAYRKWDGDEARGHETAKSVIACKECASKITPFQSREYKVVQAAEIRAPKPKRFKEPKEEYDGTY
jgi:hypothetical protein